MTSSDVRRRWIGVVCLGIAILMVVWGQLFLPPSVDPLLLIVFWLLCFFFTIAAILLAFADLRALRSHTRAENRALLEETMQKIEEEISHAGSRR